MEKYFYRPNPAGTAEGYNTEIQYSISYNKNRRLYYLSVNPVNRTSISIQIDMCAHISEPPLRMAPVKRQNKKVQAMCEDFLERHIEGIHEAYLASGYDGIRSYLVTHWLAV